MKQLVVPKRPIQKRTFVQFVFLFLGIIGLVYSGFYLTNTSFIWNGDGVSQHYLLFHDYINKLRALLSGNGFSQWDWSIGMGAGVVQSYGYYVIGDPFVYLGLLFPQGATEVAYHVLVLLRLLCIGLSFLIYAKKMDFSDKGGVIGASMYTFSHYAMMNVIRHPFFMLPMIWFPLLCLGMEKIFTKESAVFFSLMVALSAFSNFYFFYKLTLLCFFYAGVRLFQLSATNRWPWVKKVMVTGILSYLVGVLLAGVLFLPMVSGFLGSSRGRGDSLGVGLLYPVEYYTLLLKHTLIPGSFLWTVGGFSVFSLFALPVVWKEKQTFRFLPILIVFLGAGTLFPFFGSFMNGFSGPYNRYTFVLPFLIAVAGSFFFDRRDNWTLSQQRVSFGLLSFFSAVLLMYVTRGDLAHLFLFPIVIGWLIWIVLAQEQKRKQAYPHLLIGLVCLNMASNSMLYYYSTDQNTIADRVPYGSVETSYQNVFDGMEKTLPSRGTTPYRVGVTSQDSHIKNQFIYLDLMGLNSYLSLTNRALSEFSDGLETSQFQLIQPLRKGFDDRRLANHYLGVRYILTDTKNEAYLPYGYHVRSRSKENQGILLAETEHAFPFAYAERTWLPKEAYEKLHPIEKEAFLVEGVTTKERWPETQVDVFTQRLPVAQLPFVVKESDKTLLPEPRSLKVTQPNTVYNLHVNAENLVGKEVFLYLNGISFYPETNGEENYTVSLQLNERKKNVYQGHPLSFSSYFKRREVLFNMGYVPKEEGIDTFELTFNLPGEYRFDNVQLFVLEANQAYDKKIATEKRANQLHLSHFEEDFVKGSITQSAPSILVTGIPYTKGWTARVNGNPIETVEVNNGFVGIPLMKGTSEVAFEYQTPYLKEGGFMSLLGLGLLGACTWVDTQKKKREADEDEEEEHH